MRWSTGWLLGVVAMVSVSTSEAIPNRSSGLVLSVLSLADWRGSDQGMQQTPRFNQARDWYASGQYQRSIESLEILIRQLEQRHGLFSEQLVQPLTLKALAHRALKQYQQSTDVMTRAQQLTHRQQGMMTADQLPMVFLKGLNLAQMNQWWQAEQVFKTGFRISREQYGAADEATLEAARLYGSWLTMAGRYKPALSLYRSQLMELEQAHGGPHPSMSPIMKAKALTYLYERHTPDRGLRLMMERVDLMAQLESSFTASEHYDARIELAQLLMRFGRERKAQQVLESAWPWASPEQRARISGHDAIWRGPFQFASDQISPSLWFEFEYEIRADGRPQFVHLRATNARPGQAYAAISQFRQMRMRPRLQDGRAVAVPRQRQRFMIHRSDPYRDELLAPVVNHMTHLVSEATSFSMDQQSQ